MNFGCMSLLLGELRGRLKGCISQHSSFNPILCCRHGFSQSGGSVVANVTKLLHLGSFLCSPIALIASPMTINCTAWGYVAQVSFQPETLGKGICGCHIHWTGVIINALIKIEYILWKLFNSMFWDYVSNEIWWKTVPGLTRHKYDKTFLRYIFK